MLLSFLASIAVITTQPEPKPFLLGRLPADFDPQGSAPPRRMFGPPHLVEIDEGKSFVNVPVRIIIDHRGELGVDFERRPAALPITADQLPTSVPVVSCDADGVLAPGAFERNPTDEAVVHLHNMRIVRVDFWHGRGFYVRTVGGQRLFCGSGVGTLILEDGTRVETPPRPPPLMIFSPMHVSREPMPRSTTVPVQYYLDAPVVASMTPAFTLPEWRNSHAVHAFINLPEAGSVCGATDLPRATRSCIVPEGLLEPGMSYDMIASASGALGSVSILSFRFVTPDAGHVQPGLPGGPVYTLTAENTRWNEGMSQPPEEEPP